MSTFIKLVMLCFLLKFAFIYGEENNLLVKNRRRKINLDSHSSVIKDGAEGRSIASGWRVSTFNSLAKKLRNSSDNDNESWTAIVKNDTNTVRIANMEPLKKRIHKKNLELPKFVVGTIKRKSYAQEIKPINEISTTEAPSIISSVEPRGPISDKPIRIKKKYVQIQRRVLENEKMTNIETNANDDKSKKLANISSESKVSASKSIPISLDNLQNEEGRGFGYSSSGYNNGYNSLNSRPFVNNRIGTAPNYNFAKRNQNSFDQPHHQNNPQFPPILEPNQDGFIDPYKIQASNLPHNPLQHSFYGPYGPHHQPVRKHGNEGSLLPLDKTLVYFGMIVTWIFWIVAFTTYYNLWGPGYEAKYGKIRRTDPLGVSFGSKSVEQTTVSPSSVPHIVHTRSVNDNTPSDWNLNWMQILDCISLAKDSYEKFNLGDFECQKRTLCELSKNRDKLGLGETGRKISSAFTFLAVLDKLPIISSILPNFFREYIEAVDKRKNDNSCTEIYSRCKF